MNDHEVSIRYIFRNNKDSTKFKQKKNIQDSIYNSNSYNSKYIKYFNKDKN